LPWLCLPSATSALLCLAAKVCPYSHHMHSLAPCNHNLASMHALMQQAPGVEFEQG
jgi:hypothetical protein